VRKIAFLFTLLIGLLPLASKATLGGVEDFSNERIVAIFNSLHSIEANEANGSGFEYAPRIVFSAGHMKDHPANPNFFVSEPNITLHAGMKTYEVIKSTTQITTAMLYIQMISRF